MEPITIVILGFIAQQIGAHYINRLLDKVDKTILDSIGRDPQGPDLSKLRAYLESNPKIEKKVRKEIDRYGLYGVVIPPSDLLLTSEDKVILYSAVLKTVLDVTKKQRRAIVLRGFFNSVDAVSCFDYNLQLEKKTFKVHRNAIDLGTLADPYFNIYIHRPDQISFDIDEVNAMLRNEQQSAGFASFLGLTWHGFHTDLAARENRVRSVYANYMAFERARYSTSKIADVTSFTSLNDLDASEREFHLITDPYDGIETMVESVTAEAGMIYLSQEEVEKFQNLLEKLKTVGI